MATTEQLLDVLMKNYKKPEDLIGENGLLKQLTKRLLDRAMQAELTEHLGYEKHAPSGKNSGNSRNGGYKKTITGDFGLKNIAKKWTLPIRDWKSALNQFSIMYEERLSNF
jgi:putative transposase